MSKEKVDSLLDPSNIAIVGANDDRRRWPTRIHDALKQAGYGGDVFAVNPKYQQVWNEPCYPDVTSVPARVDHLVVLVPAGLVPDVLLEAAEQGARSATIYADGFDDSGSDAGNGLSHRLREVVSTTGLAVSGPNCMGNLYGRTRLLTIPDHRIESVGLGPVAVVGQSAGIAMAVNRALTARGLGVGAVVTSGNEAFLTVGDFADYLADDPDIRVIITFVEAVRNRDGFLRAAARARGLGKLIVTVKSGISELGRSAALAHTGALVGSVEAFDAVAGAAGVVRADDIDEAVELAEYAAHTPLPEPGTGLAAITMSGGLVAMLLDSGQRESAQFAVLSPSTEEQLATTLDGTRQRYNPLDSGFVGFSDPQRWLASVTTVAADPAVGMLLVQRELPRISNEREETYLSSLQQAIVDEELGCPVAAFSVAAYGLTPFGRDIRKTFDRIPFLQGTSRAVSTVSRLLGRRFHDGGRRVHDIIDQASRRGTTLDQERLGRGVVDDVSSRQLLERYGFEVPHEIEVSSRTSAVYAAKRLGWPVVVKALATMATHRSDVGGVILDCRNADDVANAFDTVASNLGPESEETSVLVCEQISTGLEVFLGARRDVEVGFVVAVGAGGAKLELYHDIAVEAIPIDDDLADRLLSSTRIDQVIRGHRGGIKYDRGSVVRALATLSEIVSDYQEELLEIEINPLLVRPVTDGGCVALDRLIVGG